MPTAVTLEEPEERMEEKALVAEPTLQDDLHLQSMMEPEPSVFAAPDAGLRARKSHHSVSQEHNHE